MLDADEQAAAAANAAWVAAHGIFPPIAPFTPPSLAAAIALGDSIPSGSYIAIAEWDFLASLEALGIGRGATSHSVLAVRRNGTLYLVESTFGWRGGDGIQAHTWNDWVTLSDAVQSSVVLPLVPLLRSAFNETAFWRYYDALEGAPCGYHNYLFSFLDTESMSLPAPLPRASSRGFFVAADDALGDADLGLFQPSYNASLMDVLGAGLNHRLRANCTTLACLVVAAAALQPPLSLMAAIALPEDPQWLHGHPAVPARVCSAFCAGGLQAALGAALPAIWTTEQVPIGNWRAQLWDADAAAAWCPWGANRSDTGTAFCQFAGTRAVTLPAANSIPPCPARK